MKRIIFYATITTFQKDKCVRLSVNYRLLVSGLGSQLSFGHNRHGHEGTIDTGCVCVECVCVCVGGGGHWLQGSGHLVDFSISIYSVRHQCIR